MKEMTNSTGMMRARQSVVAKLQRRCVRAAHWLRGQCAKAIASENAPIPVPYVPASHEIAARFSRRKCQKPVTP